jgi:glycosyltransferase involved in cell wall biosynthesis
MTWSLNKPNTELSDPAQDQFCCVLCGSNRQLIYLSQGQSSIMECTECQLLKRAPSPSNNSAEVSSGISSNREIFERCGFVITKLLQPAARVLVIDYKTGQSEANGLVQKLLQQGYDAQIANEISAPYEIPFDLIVIANCLEYSEDPLRLLHECHASLKDLGHLMILSDGYASSTAKAAFGQAQHQKYFLQPAHYQLILEKGGFNKICQYSKDTAIAPAVFVAARKRTNRAGKKLSIIMPVFNEKATFEEVFALVLKKEVAGISEKEIVIVESNSTDGSRELVSRYKDNPSVKLILEDRPKGKGHAVRAGLDIASGDVILIQDADLEYDIDDYDKLVEPLLAFRKTFILGSRYKGEFNIRRIKERTLGAILNVGHIFFVGLINILYGTAMDDPLTMFKVFRRESVHGLHFECDKFDFDHELVIKLILKGCLPQELPVGYTARSFADGKKINFINDPPMCLRADLKYRFANPYNARVTEMASWLKQPIPKISSP